ncbi:MAG TPA: head-tail adaptor protein [Azonexus sp.]|nr:head-tail adaptor protein [Azonexus sp.]
MPALVITAGMLNRRIAIRLQSEVPNGAFGLDEQYADPMGRWARHEPIHGLAIRAGKQTGEAPTDLFYVRRGTGTKPEDITGEHVIDYDGYRYRVVDAIDHEGKREFTRITTKQLGAI